MRTLASGSFAAVNIGKWAAACDQKPKFADPIASFGLTKRGGMKRVAASFFCCFGLTLSANAGELSTPDGVVWHWFSRCPDEKTISIEVTQDRKPIFTSSFHACKMRRADVKPEPVQKRLVFSLVNQKRSYFGEAKGDRLEGNLWESGSDPNDIVLGLTFATKTQIWLHTHIIVEPDKSMQFSLGKGLSLNIRPGTAAAAASEQKYCVDFTAHPALQSFSGPNVQPSIAKSNGAYRFRSAIRREASGPANFAGHLRVVSWGCGTGCHELALVDIKTGKVWLIDVPPAAVGYEYHADSTLLLSDIPSMVPGWEPGDPTAFPFSSVSYVWDDSKEVLRKLPECDGYAQRHAQSGSPVSNSRP